MRFSTCLLLLSLCCAEGANRTASPRHVEVFVGPNGSDRNVGSRSAPLNTLEAARDRLRAAGGEGHTVTLLPGTHPRAVAFQLDARDAGLTLRGQPGARLIGGQILSGFATVSNHAMLARFAEKDVARVERLSLRTGPWRGCGELSEVQAGSDVPVAAPAVFRVAEPDIRPAP
jgi:hypothetical protein